MEEGSLIIRRANASEGSCRLVVGISGASAPIYGVRTLELLGRIGGLETHLVCSHAAETTIKLETGRSLREVHDLADVVYQPDDFAAAISSGSFNTNGMIVAPCSMSTLAGISVGLTNNLLTRAADVTLKERRPLVLMVRESPLHLGHLRNMIKVTEMGGVIAPPIPSFYHGPADLEAMIDYSLGRALDVFGLDLPWMNRWSGPENG
jgi:4-hydroxy-3-polyprenylbenzoate decarboxylase